MSDTTPAPQFDPTDHNVDEVNAYLADADADERARVLGLEDGEGGKARATIVREYPADDASDEAPRDLTGVPERDDQGRPLTTRATAFTAAAAEATPDTGPGYVGTSPEAERTGRRDKGLSQRNPAVMTGGAVPDARPSVDDSAALAALREG